MAIRRYREIIIDLNNRAVEALYLQQGESKGTVIPFRVVQGGLPVDLTGYDVNFAGARPDEVPILNPCVVTDAEAGKLEYTVTAQTVSVSGKLKAAIQFVKDQEVMYSRGITCVVESSPLASVPPGQEMIYIVEKIGDVDRAVDKAAEHIEEARECAERSCECATRAETAETGAQLAESNAQGYAAIAEEAQDGVHEGVAETARQAELAEGAATRASESEVNAASSASSASSSMTEASGHASSASGSASAASQSATAASGSAIEAKGHADRAEMAETGASASASNASASEINAKESETNAKASETEATRQAGLASDSATAAKTSETNAKASETIVLGVEDELTEVIDEAWAAAEAARNAAGQTLPLATKTSAGIVQVGDGLSITEAGILSADAPDLTEELDAKVDKVEGWGLTQNNYTSADKAKVTAIPENPKYTDTVTTINGKTGAIAKADIVALGIPSTNTTYSVATTTADGLMSSGDKSKLEGVEAGANNYSLPTASPTVKGGVKVGTGLEMVGDTLNATVQEPDLSGYATTTQVGDASEAPSVEDKSSVWAGLESVSSKLGGLRFTSMTQTEYDSLPTKDPNTIYFTVEV